MYDSNLTSPVSNEHNYKFSESKLDINLFGTRKPAQRNTHLMLLTYFFVKYWKKIFHR